MKFPIVFELCNGNYRCLISKQYFLFVWSDKPRKRFESSYIFIFHVKKLISIFMKWQYTVNIRVPLIFYFWIKFAVQIYDIIYNILVWHVSSHTLVLRVLRFILLCFVPMFFTKLRLYSDTYSWLSKYISCEYKHIPDVI